MSTERRYEYETETYWLLEAYYMGRLSLLGYLRHRNATALEAYRESSRSILKYRTMALISEDRELDNQ